MIGKRIVLILFAAAAVPLAFSTASAETWRLTEDRQWQPVSQKSTDRFLLAVAEAKELVNTRKTKAAQKAYQQLKTDFPEIAGTDLDAFIKAEILLSRGRFATAAAAYDRMLTEYPETALRDASLERQFELASAYLAGRKIAFLGLFKIKGYAEGIKIMERITDQTGIDSPLGLKAAVAVAENYEQRRMFNEAYLKWWEIAIQYRIGPTAKQALLGMARNRHASYNKPVQSRRPAYDAARLDTAKSYYEKFRLLYPEDANEIGTDDIIKQIDEQLAQKQLTIAKYYHRTGRVQAANLYYDMVARNWPDTQAARLAAGIRQRNRDAETPKRNTNEQNPSP
jgi:tetratricopeptide (TPR) repeat protein